MAYTSKTPKIILSLAGSDSLAGAGIQADLKTAHSLQTYCATVLTAITAQNSQGVHAVQMIDASVITAQIDALLSDFGERIGALKIGMLGDAHTTTVVANHLQKHFTQTPIVLDTVMRATSGGELLDSAGRDVLIQKLLPIATVITPNLIEASLLLDQPQAVSLAQMEKQGQDLIKMGAHNAIIKGGHSTSDDATDILVCSAQPEQALTLTAPKIATNHTHGTGCTLSTAIACFLAQGEPLELACKKAKDYVSQAIARAASWQLVESNGPLSH